MTVIESILWPISICHYGLLIRLNVEECVRGRICHYGMESEEDASNCIKVEAWLVITALNLRTHSQPETFGLQKNPTHISVNRFQKTHVQASEFSVHIPCSLDIGLWITNSSLNLIPVSNNSWRKKKGKKLCFTKAPHIDFP